MAVSPLQRTSTTTNGAPLRRSAYALLTVASAGLVGAHILMGPPAYSVNDQSRWLTIRALADTGTYTVGRRYTRGDGTYQDRGIMTEPGWYTNDILMHPTTQRFYSTKPTLLPTLLAGEYWLLRSVLNLEITRDRLAVSRTILFTINWLPFVLYLVCLARLVERLGTTDWGRLFVFTTACFGTFVTGFLPSLNNHTVAATGALFAVYHCVCIHLDQERRWWQFALAGLFAGWTVVNELPAAALAAGLTLWLLWRSPGHTLRAAVPAMLVPMAAYLLTQYQALGSIVPTYARQQWYLFEGSYWRAPIGIDRANDGLIVYAFNLLVGHTGILSLTPALLLGWLGMARSVARADESRRGGAVGQNLAWLTLLLTIITFVFYIVRTNNYGGIASGPRWFFWLVPLWLLTMLPEADRWARRRGLRGLAYVLLVVSVGSVSYALANPWRYSWLFVWLRDLGVVRYD